MYQLLENIKSPQDLKHLTIEQLESLSNEIRQFLLSSVSTTGGHFSSNLGSIELTVALHHVYNTPNDLLVWDVGHQTYAHKILTGRKDRMDTMRKFQGLSGFPNLQESEYDTFGVGHSSTSISAALGMAVAKDYQHKYDKVVAIIGDGGMTAGLAYEGLNNAGWLSKDLLIILNDNEMSISENVGAISRYLSKIITSRFYNTIKQSANDGMKNHPLMRQIAHKVEEHIKGIVTPSSTMFEEFGFNYTGPIDGHDIPTLVRTFQQLKQLKGAQFLHIVTKKGQGYKLAEDAPTAYHGVNKFDLEQGLKSGSGLATDYLSCQQLSTLTYTQVFGKWLCDTATVDKNFVAITPAMREGSGMVEFAQAYPDRFFDVGIAEQHAVTFAAGVATQGVKAVVAIYSTFLQRAYDQVIHDVALQNLPVLFAVDRGGLVGADGATHIGAFDLSYLRCIPNMVVIAPSTQYECYQALDFGYALNAPVAVRYPRGQGINNANYSDQVFNEDGIAVKFELGKAKVLCRGKSEENSQKSKIAFLAFGTMVNMAFELAQEFNATCVDMRFVKPLDEMLLLEMANTHETLVILEENTVVGGASSACLEVLSDAYAQSQMQDMPRVLRFGLPDEFVDHGDIPSLLNMIGLTKEKISGQLQKILV